MAMWKTLDSAPKDGTRVIWGGRWKNDGRWHQEIFMYGSILGSGKHPKWFNDGFRQPESYNIEWTHWTNLPDEPEKSR